MSPEHGFIRNHPRQHYPGVMDRITSLIIGQPGLPSPKQPTPRTADEFNRQRLAGLQFLSRQRATWYLDNANLRTVICALLDGVWIASEAKSIVTQILEKPWHWRVDFVCGRCRELDLPEST